MGKFSVTDPIQYHLPAIELVNLGEHRLGGVREPRNRRLVLPGGRNRLWLFRILDIPNPVQGDSRSLGPHRESGRATATDRMTIEAKRRPIFIRPGAYLGPRECQTTLVSLLLRSL